MAATTFVSAACATFLLAAVAAAQTVTGGNAERILTFAATQSPAGRQEIINAVRSVAEVPLVTEEPPRDEVRVKGSARQVELVAWLFARLDQAASEPGRSVQEYPLPGTPDTVARVYYPQNFQTPQQLQEFVNIARALGEITRIFPCNTPARLALVADATHANLADWLLNQLDKPAANIPAEPAKLHWEDPWSRRPQSPKDPVSPDLLARLLPSEVRVSYVSSARSPQELQEIVNALRAVTETSRLMAFTPLKAIAWRASPEQDAVGAWFLRELDAPGTSEYLMKGEGGVVRVIRFPKGTTPQAMQISVNAVRKATGLTRLLPVPARNLLLLRGSVSQITQAEALLRENGAVAAP